MTITTPATKVAEPIDERALFEAWAANKYPLALQNHSLGGYARNMKRCAEEAWQARAALGRAVAPSDAVGADQLRALGLTVAVHNDYRLNGEAHTFWLFTDNAGMSYKGEGKTDAEALAAVLASFRASSSAQPASPTLPKWIDNLKGSDPTIDSIIEFIEGRATQVATVTGPSRVSDAARTIATSYECGTLATLPETNLGATIHLHYSSPADAENAFEALSGLIDAALIEVRKELA